jgi:hypothetical protein
MPRSPLEIGTLVVVVLQAVSTMCAQTRYARSHVSLVRFLVLLCWAFPQRNLPNRRHIEKRNAFCTLRLGNQTRRTEKRGHQNPFWDEEVRFVLHEDTEGELARTTGEHNQPPPPPARNGGVPSIRGGKWLRLACYYDGPPEPGFVGETYIDATQALAKGEVDSIVF